MDLFYINFNIAIHECLEMGNEMYVFHIHNVKYGQFDQTLHIYICIYIYIYAYYTYRVYIIYIHGSLCLFCYSLHKFFADPRVANNKLDSRITS